MLTLGLGAYFLVGAIAAAAVIWDACHTAAAWKQTRQETGVFPFVISVWALFVGWLIFLVIVVKENWWDPRRAEVLRYRKGRQQRRTHL